MLNNSVYKFSLWGMKFAVDSESGNFFEIDDVAYDTLEFFTALSEDRIIEKLSFKYGAAAIKKAIMNIACLKRKGAIFSKGRPSNLKFGRDITDLTLNVTDGCNLACSYCWNRGGAYSRKKKKNPFMSKDTALSSVNVLVKESNKARDLVVDFYGGEPLLNYPVIKEVILYCQAIAKQAKKRFRFLLATNGTLFDREKAVFLMENGVDVAISIDGPENIQDKQRPFLNGEGSFSAVIKNIRSLPERLRRRLVARATFTPYSTSIVETFNYLRGLGFGRIEICESERAGYNLTKSKQNFFFNKREGLELLKSLYVKLANYYTDEILKRRLNYENTYFNRFFKQLSRLYHIQSISGSCSAGSSQIAVDIDGKIYPCTAFIGIRRYSIGHVNKDVMTTRVNNFLGTRETLSPKCLACWAKSICQGCGSCYNINYFTSKNLNEPNPHYCELFLHKTKLMIAMLSRIGKQKPFLLDEVLIPEYYSTRGRNRKK